MKHQAVRLWCRGERNDLPNLGEAREARKGKSPSFWSDASDRVLIEFIKINI